jgi:hypothetical protein
MWRSLIFALLSTMLIFNSLAVPQSKVQKPDLPRKDEGKVPTQKEIQKNKEKIEKGGQNKLSAGEIIAEFVIFAYGGRAALTQARAAIQEEGTIRLATDQGEITGNYMLRSIRKEKSWQDLLRNDLELTTPEAAQRVGAPPTIKYVIAFNGASVWSAQNDRYTNVTPEAEAAFRAQLVHDYTALLRYKEDGSKVELIGPETVAGIDTKVVELTNLNGEKTRYWISAKTYRILHAEYEVRMGSAEPIKFHIAYFYTPLRIVQNTLVPSRRVMTQDGRFVQEITLTNVTYSAKLDPEIFQHLQQS